MIKECTQHKTKHYHGMEAEEPEHHRLFRIGQAHDGDGGTNIDQLIPVEMQECRREQSNSVEEMSQYHSGSVSTQVRRCRRVAWVHSYVVRDWQSSLKAVRVVVPTCLGVSESQIRDSCESKGRSFGGMIMTQSKSR